MRDARGTGFRRILILSRASFLGGPVAAISVAALFALFCAACASPGPNSAALSGPSVDPGITGSGSVATREIDPGEFTSVQARSAFKVDIVSSQSHHVTLRADDNIIDSIDVSTQGDTLTIGLKPGSYRSTTLQARVSLPSLRRLDLSEATSATLSGFKELGELQLRMSGASKLIGRAELDAIRIEATEASTITLGGSAASLDLDASGASQLNLGDLALESVNARLSESSKATVNVSGRLEANLRGASTLYYVGSPTLGNVATTEASSVKKR